MRMKIPALPACHDLVRLDRQTLPATIPVLLEHLKRKPVPWSYQKARDLAPAAFDPSVPISALKSACDLAKTQVGRASNWEVVQLIRAAGLGRTVQCHALRDGWFSVRSDLSIRVAADFYFIEGGKAKVFWLQPRRGFALTNTQMGMFGALARMALLTGEFIDAELEILDLSAPEKERVPQILGLGDLPTVSEDQVEDCIQRVVSAYDAIRAMDLDWGTIRGRPPKKDKPSAQDSMDF